MHYRLLFSSHTAEISERHGRIVITVHQPLESVVQSGWDDDDSKGDVEEYERESKTDRYDDALLAPLAMMI